MPKCCQHRHLLKTSLDPARGQVNYVCSPTHKPGQTNLWSVTLNTLYLSTCHAVKNGVFLTSRCLTTVNVRHPGGGVATLLMCESPPYPCPCCFSSWDPWIRGACWFLLLHPPNPHRLCSPKAGPSLQEAGRGCRLYQIAECEQRTMRNWNEITKSIWFIWDLSLGLLGESECINPLWELIPCLVIIQASLKYALC